MATVEKILTESMENKPVPMSWHDAKREALFMAGVIDQAIVAQQFMGEHEAVIRSLTADIDRLTTERDTLAKNLEAEKVKADASRAALQQDLATWQAKVEAAKAEHAEILARADSAREEMRKIQAQLGVPVTG